MGRLRNRLWRAMALVGIVVGAVICPAAWAGSRAQVEERVEAVDAFIRSAMDRHRIVGMAVAITEGEEIVHLQGFGTAGDGRAVTADTPFYIGSVSKSFTALAVMQLVEAGEIDLDAPVQRYIPWFSVADERAAAEITVRHLLHQTSGLSNAGYRRGMASADATLEETVRDLQRAELTAPVGTTHQYFNLNYNVLGLIIEVVSGESYGAYVRDHIFAPLGMEHSFVVRQAAEEAGLAQGHGVVLGFPVARRQPHLAYDLPAGMLISSVADMARYAVAQNNGGCVGGSCVLSAEGVEAMHTPPNGVESTYAMGWTVGEEEGLRHVTHSGSVRTFFSRVTLLPERGYGMVLLVNQNGLLHLLMAHEEIAEGIIDLLVGREATTGIPLTVLYAVIAGAIALDLLRHVLRLARLPRWGRQWKHRGGFRWVAIGLTLQGLVALTIIVGGPLLLVTRAGTDAAQVVLVYYAPGIAAWLALSALLTLVEVVLKMRWVIGEGAGEPKVHL